MNFHAPQLSLRNWIRLLLAGVLASVLFVVGFNYLVDPYDVFRSGHFPPAAPYNDRFNKTAYLIGDDNAAPGYRRFNSYIVGSSIMGAFDPAVADTLMPGRHFYNASFLGGTPADALKILKLIKKKGGAVEDVLLGLEAFPFLQAEDNASPSKQHHFAITGEQPSRFYSRYLFASSLFHGWVKISSSYNPAFIRFDLANGRYILEQNDRDIGADPDAYVTRTFRRGNSSSVRQGSTKAAWIESRFTEFFELVEWAKAENVKLHLFIHPLHPSMLNELSRSVMDDLRNRVISISGTMPDYSASPAPSGVDSLYYDHVHYRPALAERVMTDTLGRHESGN